MSTRELVAELVRIAREAKAADDPMEERALAEEETDIRAELYEAYGDAERLAMIIIEREVERGTPTEVIVDWATRVLTRLARRTHPASPLRSRGSR